MTGILKASEMAATTAHGANTKYSLGQVLMRVSFMLGDELDTADCLFRAKRASSWTHGLLKMGKRIGNLDCVEPQCSRP